MGEDAMMAYKYGDDRRHCYRHPCQPCPPRVAMQQALWYRHDAMHGAAAPPIMDCAVAHLVPRVIQDMHVPTGGADSQDLVGEAEAGDLVARCRDAAHIAPQTLVLQVGFENLPHVALCGIPP